ncbi:hypothetical protein M3J09_013038 [Ascochyta lentis]
MNSHAQSTSAVLMSCSSGSESGGSIGKGSVTTNMRSNARFTRPKPSMFCMRCASLTSRLSGPARSARRLGAVMESSTWLVSVATGDMGGLASRSAS